MHLDAALVHAGKVYLIDNDQVFTTAWRRCGIDSMIVSYMARACMRAWAHGRCMCSPIRLACFLTVRHWPPSCRILLLCADVCRFVNYFSWQAHVHACVLWRVWQSAPGLERFFCMVSWTRTTTPFLLPSLQVPTTQKWMINHLGFFYVLKYPQKVRC